MDCVLLLLLLLLLIVSLFLMLPLYIFCFGLGWGLGCFAAVAQVDHLFCCAALLTPFLCLVFVHIYMSCISFIIDCPCFSALIVMKISKHLRGMNFCLFMFPFPLNIHELHTYPFSFSFSFTCIMNITHTHTHHPNICIQSIYVLWPSENKSNREWESKWN